MKPELEDVLQHFGTKGMKWGVRKKKDEINSKDRVIKKGTEMQTVTSRAFEKSNRHLYTSYTKYDSVAYKDMMGTYMYGGKAYTNTFAVKKDIRIPSDQKLVDEFHKLVKENPEQVAKDMTAAYNDTRRFLKKKDEYFQKKLSKVDGKNIRKGEKATKEFVTLMASDKLAESRAKFFGGLKKKGYDGISDLNDREGGTQDPLILFNAKSSIGKVHSVKLTDKELQEYFAMTMFDKKYQKSQKDLSEVQHNQEVRSMKPELQDILQHHGVKGMKWGKHKSALSSGVKSVGDKTKEIGSKVADNVKSRVDSVKRENSWKKQLKNVHNMSTKDIQKVASRAQLENDMKRLSKKKKVGSKKDKQDYLKRGNMDDQELQRKVQRLRVKDNLHRNVADATKSQREAAKRIVQIAAPIAVQYALTGKVGKSTIVNAAINTAVNAGGEKARIAKSIYDQTKHIKPNKKVQHGIEDEETLQHHGVKGMHWGVHKKVQKMVKEHRAKQNKKMLESHDKLVKKNKTYKKLYAHNSKRYKSHLAAVRKTHQQVRQINGQKVKLALTAAALAAPHVAPHLGTAASAASKAVRNQDNINKAKNVAQALKRSPIRYVDGKKMKNVIN